MKILIAGDVVPKSNNFDLFENGDIKKVLGNDLYNIWNSTEYKFFNLECPITNSNRKIKKCGPNLKAPKVVVDGIKKMNPTCVFLSNNHILDYGQQGIKDTMKIFNDSNIEYIGIGENTKEINKYFLFKTNNHKFAIYNCCEHEFSGATICSPGSNEVDLLNIFDEIKKLKEDNDFVIVVYHGGKEFYQYPSPFLQKICKKMVECGADLVTCQHSHCIGTIEQYKNGTIVYGQGNFIFDGNVNDLWNSGIILDIDVNVNKKMHVDFIPIIKTESGTRLADITEKKYIIDELLKRSKLLTNGEKMYENYSQFSKENIYDYLYALHGDGKLMKVFKKIFGKKFIKIFYNEKAILKIINFVECEAHRELLIEGLKNQIKE